MKNQIGQHDWGEEYAEMGRACAKTPAERTITITRSGVRAALFGRLAIGLTKDAHIAGFAPARAPRVAHQPEPHVDRRVVTIADGLHGVINVPACNTYPRPHTRNNT